MKGIIKSIFRFRDKKQAIGIIMGSICFIPTFGIIYMITLKHFLLGMIVLLISQYLWLTSIGLCCNSLENENRKLKQKLEELENNK